MAPIYLIILFLLSFLFRYPLLLNAEAVNSDHAVVGLQAIEFLNGHGSWFLWGTGYQGAVEPLLVALGYQWLGSTALVLMGVAFIGHLLQVTLAYRILLYYVTPRLSFLFCLPVIFTCSAATQVSLCLPRQWAITTIFFALWAFVVRKKWATFVGAFLCIIAMYIDFITVIFLVPTVALGYVEFYKKAERKKELPFFISGLVVAGILLLITRGLRPEGGVPLAYSPLRMFYHLKLFFIDCLPVLFGFPSDIFFVRHELPHLTLYLLFSYLLAGLFFTACVLAYKKGRQNNLVLFALGSIAICCVGFLGSSTAADVYSTRYLLPLLWISPLMLLGIKDLFLKPAVKLGFISYVVAIYAMGWVSIYPYVQNGMPVRDPDGYFAEEQALFTELRQRGIKSAKAQYWQAYRLSLLSQKNPLVVPYADFDDRYAPYARAVNGDKRYVIIVHPNEPRLPAEAVREDLKKQRKTWKEFNFQRFILFEVSA